MEGPSPSSDGSLQDDEARPLPREAGVVHRWLTWVIIFVLDTLWKAINIIFWYFVWTPVFRIWEH